MNLKLTVRTIYGVRKYYPACEKSTLLVQLTGHKTFTAQNIDILKQLGFIIQNATVVEEI